MKIKTLFYCLLLLLMFTSTGCKTVDNTPTDMETAQKELDKRRKEKAKQDKKSKKQAMKHYWSLQTKEAKRSIRKNKRRQKKKTRKANGGFLP